jgi:hypothetical protein
MTPVESNDIVGDLVLMMLGLLLSLEGLQKNPFDCVHGHSFSELVSLLLSSTEDFNEFEVTESNGDISHTFRIMNETIGMGLGCIYPVVFGVKTNLLQIVCVREVVAVDVPECRLIPKDASTQREATAL